MDTVVNKPNPASAEQDRDLADASGKPSREQAEEAVRTLIRWAGDDPGREGLLDTPARVVRSYEEFFAGYDQDPEEVLMRTFEEVGGYDEIVLVKDIELHTHCEHHMVPIIGKAHVAYLPDGKVLGLSKIARVVDIFARRLQTQEAMTAQIAGAIQEVVNPLGVAVMIEAEHMCMAMRGIQKSGARTITSAVRGTLQHDAKSRAEAMTLIMAR